MGLELAVLAAGLLALVWIARRSPVVAVLVVCAVGGLVQTGVVRPDAAVLDLAVKGERSVATWQERQATRISCRQRVTTDAGLDGGVDCR